MKALKLIINTGIILVFLLQTGCKETNKETTALKAENISIGKDALANEAWNMEEQYWVYVQENDTTSYKTLWHDDFIGYPSFGDGVSGKSNIAIWIPKLHKDPNLKFSYKLYKKAVNVIDEVVLTFYDADEIWSDNENNVVRKETIKITHTWKKYDGNWLILGGMAGNKD